MKCTDQQMMRADIIVGIFDSDGKVHCGLCVTIHNARLLFLITIPQNLVPSQHLILRCTDLIILFTILEYNRQGITNDSVRRLLFMYTSITFERALVTNDTVADWPIQDGDMT